MMGGKGSGQLGCGVIKSEADFARLFDMYKRLGTLKAVGDKLGITRERVRQLLNKGNDKGHCQYSGKWRICARLPHLAEALQVAETWAQAGKLMGYRHNAGCQGAQFVCHVFKISRQQVHKLFKRNRRARLLNEAREWMVRLNTPMLCSTVMQRKHKTARALYALLTREFGSIQKVRRLLGLSGRKLAYVKRSWGQTAEDALRERGVIQ